MINNKKVLAIIPARGGSKGIPNKNIVNLSGKPLIYYSIKAAKNSKYIDKVYVSTDSIEIADIAEKYGIKVSHLRPECFSTDYSKIIDVVIYCIEDLKKEYLFYDIIIILQPTQPLRTTKDIDASLEEFISHECKGLVSVSEVTDSPVLIRTIEGNGSLKRIIDINSTIRRQDMKTYYRVNGAIYINSSQDIKEGLSFNDNEIPYIMEKSRSIDIDEKIDLVIAEEFIKFNKEHGFEKA